MSTEKVWLLVVYESILTKHLLWLMKKKTFSILIPQPETFLRGKNLSFIEFHAQKITKITKCIFWHFWGAVIPISNNFVWLKIRHPAPGGPGLSTPTFWDLLNGSFFQIAQNCNKTLQEKKVSPELPHFWDGCGAPAKN